MLPLHRNFLIEARIELVLEFAVAVFTGIIGKPYSLWQIR